MRHLVAGWAVLLALLGGSAAWGAELVVLEVTGAAAGVPARGAVLSDHVTLDVPDQVEITLLADTGQIVRIAGPVRRPLAELVRGRTSSLSLRRLAVVLRGGGEGRAVLGAVRSGVGRALPDPWVIDVTTAGTKCAFRDQPVVLWRPPAATPADVALEASSPSRRSVFTWPARTHTVPWPSNLPLEPSGTYTVTVGGAAARTFTLSVAPVRPAPGPALVHLAERGCIVQLDRLLSILWQLPS